MSNAIKMFFALMFALLVAKAPGSSADFPKDRISGFIRWNKAYGFPGTHRPVGLKNSRLVTVRAADPCSRFSVTATVYRASPNSFGANVRVGQVAAGNFKENPDSYQCLYQMGGLPGGEPITVSAFLNNQLWIPGSDPLSGNAAYDKALQPVGGPNVITLLRTRPDFPATATVNFQMVLTPKQIVR